MVVRKVDKGNDTMSLWNVGVLAQAFTRSVVPSDLMAYTRTVRAETRRQAVEKCLPDILKIECDDPTILYIAVYCGRKGSVTGAATRLSPMTLVRVTGKIK